MMKKLMRKFWVIPAFLTVLIFAGSNVFQDLIEQMERCLQNISNSPTESARIDRGMPLTFAQTETSQGDNSRAIGVRGKDRPRFALVIGNAKYSHIPRLSNPRNDAFDIKRSLEKLDFKVTYLANARDRRAMTEAVRDFGIDLMRHQDAVGLFFYAGHAMQINGVNYLIPTDAVIKGEADVEFETLNVNYLLQTMDTAQNGMNIIIMDACRNNPYARGFRSVVDRGLAPMDSPTGSIIVYATAPGKTAADGDGRNGTFTKHLLRHMDQPEMTIEQMLKHVRIGVTEETDGSQTPWETSSLRGDFCFTGCPDQTAIEREALEKAKANLEQTLEEQQQRLEKERKAMEVEWARIKAKKLEMKIKATEAQQLKDQESLDRIRAEQGSLAEQNLLIKKEQDRIEQQEALLTNQNESDFQKENEIARLKQEQEKFEKERVKLEQLRAEAEKARRRAESARKANLDEAERLNRKKQSVTPMVGF